MFLTMFAGRPVSVTKRSLCSLSFMSVKDIMRDFAFLWSNSMHIPFFWVTEKKRIICDRFLTGSACCHIPPHLLLVSNIVLLPALFSLIDIKDHERKKKKVSFHFLAPMIFIKELSQQKTPLFAGTFLIIFYCFMTPAKKTIVR